MTRRSRMFNPSAVCIISVVLSALPLSEISTRKREGGVLFPSVDAVCSVRSDADSSVAFV